MIMRQVRGSAFIVVVVVLAGLVALLAGATAARRAEFQLQMARMESQRAQLAAESGLRFAMSRLETQDPNWVTLADDWTEYADSGSVSFELDRNEVRIEILDEASFINLNSADQGQLESLGLTPEQVDSILDWRNPEREPRPEGAKDEFYNDLIEPYNARLQNFTSVDELLLVKGISGPQVYEFRANQTSTGGASAAIESEQLSLYDMLSTDSQSTNSTAEGQSRANINNAGVQQLVGRGISPQAAQQIVQRRPQGGYSTMGDALQAPSVDVRTAGLLLDNYSIGTAETSDGKINVNTAPEAVLLTLPGIASDVAASIVSRQNPGLQSLSEFASVPGVTIENLRQWGDRVSVSSTTFRVRSLGRAGSTVVCIEGLVRLDSRGARLLRQWEPPERDMRARWRWDNEATNTLNLSEGNG